MPWKRATSTQLSSNPSTKADGRVFAPGAVLGERYEIEGPLGRGGMAHVFAAHDRHLDRPVALKVLRPHLTDTDAERFRREIRALARLSHPGIVSIFDLGSGDQVYFVMERIEGGPFTQLGPLEGDLATQSAFLKAATIVADTLGYVHELGMVHRDLTPSNILLTPRGHPKLMDFGLVQLTESSKELTRTGFTLGTPAYMAPEQATGRATGAATDLYALGVVLYRTVTGRPPFEAENDQAILYQHVYGAAVPAIEVNPYVPGGLSDLIGQLLEKSPERRPRSGYEVAEALRSIAADVGDAVAGVPAAGATRSGMYPFGPVLTTRVRERWRTRIEQGPQWPAGCSAADGFLLVGARDDSLAILRACDGEPHGRLDLPDEAIFAPLVVDRHLWVASRDGSTKIASWPDARVVREFDAMNACGVAPVGRDVVVARSDGRIERRTASGEDVWSTSVGTGLVHAPIVHRGLVFVTGASGSVHALHVDDGRPSFQTDLHARPAPCSAAGGTVFLGEHTGEFHGFDLDTRTVVWSFGIDGQTYAGPACWEGRLYVAGWSRTLHCLAQRTGDEVWCRDLPGRVTAPVTIAGGVAWVVTETGHLLGFDARDGTQVVDHVVSAAAIQAPVLPVGRSLIVASTDGTIVAYD